MTLSNSLVKNLLNFPQFVENLLKTLYLKWIYPQNFVDFYGENVDKSVNLRWIFHIFLDLNFFYYTKRGCPKSNLRVVELSRNHHI